VKLLNVIHRRRSVKRFNPDRAITEAELIALFSEVIESPSSFNLQHWRFIVVRDPERRRRLCELSWGQRPVETASALILVLGYLKAHRDVAEICADAPPSESARMIPMISGFYQARPQLQRDEAIRSGSLAAMTLMLVAQEMGLATCPMIGFDAEAVCQCLGVDDLHVPVMMICLGERVGEAPRRGHRFPLSRVVRLETFDGPGLTGAEPG
jgi:nitroreductase